MLDINFLKERVTMTVTIKNVGDLMLRVFFWCGRYFTIITGM